MVHIAGQVKDMVEALPANERGIFNKPWVRMHGFVPDIAQFYREMDVILSPVTMGTGMNIKTAQAMAYGMPLLATAWGCKGIETNDSMHSHSDLDALAGSLIGLVEKPNELNRLASVSQVRYERFYQDCANGFARLFSHPKIASEQRFSPVEMSDITDRISIEV